MNPIPPSSTRKCCSCGKSLRMAQYRCTCGHLVQGCHGVTCRDSMVYVKKILDPETQKKYSDAQMRRWHGHT